MTDFFELSIEAKANADRFVNDTGGLPEIWRASADLRTALDRTRQEIAGAIFAPNRFPARPISPERQYEEGSQILPNGTPPGLRSAVVREGASGAKRYSLETDLTRIEHGLSMLLHELVILRTDLVVSQDPMEISEAVGEAE
jgi:hypothetical protein